MAENMRVAGKVALVTGAAGGMGAAHARMLVEHGAKVVVADVVDELGAALADELGDDACFVHLDVTDPGSWANAVAAADERFGPVTVLINNAGILRLETVETETLDSYRSTVNVNQVGAFLGMQAVIPGMKKAGSGSIINISSSAGIVGFVGNFAYVASKWAIRGMTKAAALELASDRIRVNSIMPGEVHTAMIADMDLDMSATPLGRFGDPREIAYLALYLASDESLYTTGADHVIDGGYTAG